MVKWTSVPGKTGASAKSGTLDKCTWKIRYIQWTSVPGKTGLYIPILTSQLHLQKVVHFTNVPLKYGTMTWKIWYNGLASFSVSNIVR